MKQLTIVPILLLCTSVFGQAPAAPAAPSFPTETVNTEFAPISLPGLAKTVVGADANLFVRITTNFDLRQESILAQGANDTLFFGEANYHFPQFSSWLKKKSPYLNGYKFDLYATGGAGVYRNAKLGTQHWAEIGGAGVRYALTSSGGFTLGTEVRVLNAPGFARWVPVVSLGPEWNFFKH